MQPADHGSDYARMTTSESTGYAKAMLDCIDWLTLQMQREAEADHPMTSVSMRVAAEELSAYRNAKLSAPMQPLLTRVELPHTSTSPPGGLRDA